MLFESNNIRSAGYKCFDNWSQKAPDVYFPYFVTQERTENNLKFSVCAEFNK